MENNSLYNKKSYTGRTLFSIVIIVLLATLPFHYVLKDTIMNSGTDPLGNSMKTVDKYADFRVFPKENFTLPPIHSLWMMVVKCGF